MTPVSVAIFDDNRDFRESLLTLFSFNPDIVVTGAWPDCSDLKTVIQNTRPQVVLMDIDMPGMNGIEATAVVKEINPEIQVVMLTVSEEESRIFQALRNGATGYLLKRTSPDELVESVRTVFRGGSPMSPAIARKVLQYFHQSPIPQTEVNTTANSPGITTENMEDRSGTLTPREREILEGLVDGLSYKMIAARYFISTDTVKNHIQGIYKKLHVHSKGEAISLVLKKGYPG